MKFQKIAILFLVFLFVVPVMADEDDAVLLGSESTTTPPAVPQQSRGGDPDAEAGISGKGQAAPGSGASDQKIESARQAEILRQRFDRGEIVEKRDASGNPFLFVREAGRKDSAIFISEDPSHNGRLYIQDEETGKKVWAGPSISRRVKDMYAEWAQRKEGHTILPIAQLALQFLQQNPPSERRAGEAGSEGRSDGVGGVPRVDPHGGDNGNPIGGTKPRPEEGTQGSKTGDKTELAAKGRAYETGSEATTVKALGEEIMQGETASYKFKVLRQNCVGSRAPDTVGAQNFILFSQKPDGPLQVSTLLPTFPKGYSADQMEGLLNKLVEEKAHQPLSNSQEGLGSVQAVEVDPATETPKKPAVYVVTQIRCASPGGKCDPDGKNMAFRVSWHVGEISSRPNFIMYCTSASDQGTEETGPAKPEDGKTAESSKAEDKKPSDKTTPEAPKADGGTPPAATPPAGTPTEAKSGDSDPETAKAPPSGGAAKKPAGPEAPAKPEATAEEKEVAKKATEHAAKVSKGLAIANFVCLQCHRALDPESKKIALQNITFENKTRFMVAAGIKPDNEKTATSAPIATMPIKRDARGEVLHGEVDELLPADKEALKAYLDTITR